MDQTVIYTVSKVSEYGWYNKDKNIEPAAREVELYPDANVIDFPSFVDLWKCSDNLNLKSLRESEPQKLASYIKGNLIFDLPLDVAPNEFKLGDKYAVTITKIEKTGEN